MARPSKYPFWATQDEVDSFYGTANKIEPSQEKQDFGQRGNKNTFRQDINFLFNKIREWIQFFDEQYELGHIVFEDNDSGQAPTEEELSNTFGGTWEFIDGINGQTTLAGRQVVGYRKISEVNV